MAHIRKLLQDPCHHEMMSPPELSFERIILGCGYLVRHAGHEADAGTCLQVRAGVRKGGRGMLTYCRTTSPVALANRALVLASNTMLFATTHTRLSMASYYEVLCTESLDNRYLYRESMCYHDLEAQHQSSLAPRNRQGLHAALKIVQQQN